MHFYSKTHIYSYLCKAGLLCAVLLFSVSCGDDDNDMTPPVDNFDRQAMLINWADNIIIPGYLHFSQKTEVLKTASEIFINTPNQAALNELRNAWEEAYIAWQRVSMFEIGRAEELRLRDNLNIYPTDTSEIRENINTGDYDLTLPSLNDQQGFPALDYMLYGLGANDAAILDTYSSQAYRDYLTDLTARIDQLTQSVLNNWQNSFRDDFVENDGNSATASVDKLVNDYIFYYEKALRAGKIGIPAGVFSGTTLSSHVEAFYRKDLSKTLFLTALDAVQNFFNGKHFNDAITGESLATYLNFLNTMKNGSDLTQLINDQFDATRNQAQMLEDNFHQQVETDNAAMLTTYDELQKNVVLLKVDMLQALNINVDFVDTDGD